MTLTRWNPMRDMLTLQRELDRVLNSRMTKGNNAEEYESSVWSPMVDINETEDQYTIELDIPGISDARGRLDHIVG